MKAVGSKIPDDQYEKLRWLAYREHTTVSAIVARYIEEGLRTADLGAYPPDPS